MCDSSTKTFGPIPVWTGKSNSAWLFFPVSGAEGTGSVKDVRSSLEVSQSTGDLEIRAAMRTSNDGCSWSTPVGLSAQTQANDGTSYGSSYIDLWDDTTFPNNALQEKQLVQFGIFVKNISGTSVEMANATLRMTIRG